MSEENQVEHKYCGTPLCCQQCESAILEDAPANSVGAGGFTNAADATGPAAGFDPVIRFQKKMKYKILQRKKQKEQSNANRR